MLHVDSLSRYTSPKIVPFAKAQTLIAKYKKNGKTIGLCHGGYDLLHPGHITHFQSSKNACDVLFVSVTADQFVAGRKGIGRPIFTDKLRAYMIASLTAVDYVVVTDYKSGVDVINFLKPSLYIKGPDFIGKQTPGIIAERKAITDAGGKMLYTNDPKLSTTEIIQYIKKNIIDDALLLVIDRDGTLIRDAEFLGKEKNWRDKLEINREVAAFIYYLQTKHQTTKLVISNQTGVARGFFTEKTVKNINNTIAEELKKFSIKIDAWEYCPYADEKFSVLHPEYNMPKKYIQKITKRKPAPDMVHDALRGLHLTTSNFKSIIVLGDREEDRSLALNLNAQFLDVKGKSYQSLLSEFQNLTKV